MTQPPVTVTYSLEEILKEINQKLNTLNEIQVKLAELQVEVQKIKEDIQELKGSSKAQIWALIGLLTTAVSGFLLAVGRYVISGNP